MKFGLWSDMLLVAGAMYAASGCSHDVRLDARLLRDVKVGTVSHYGLTLDPAAGPKAVAFVALKAIREDFEAGRDEAKRSAALDVQFDVCAADVIAAQNSSSRTRAEQLLAVVRMWTPTVSHYVADFPGTFEDAQKRFVERPHKAGEGEPEQVDVLLEVDEVQAGRDPKARVVLAVYLVKDGGYWRVTHVGFDAPQRDIQSRRRIAAKPTTAPAPASKALNPATP